LSLRRETSAPPYQSITRFLAVSEWTSLAFRGRCKSLDFEHGGHRFSRTASRYSDGRTAEIFLSSLQVGLPLEPIVH
jgi:hypothetical protein